MVHERKGLFPVLEKCRIAQNYDYPFPYPKPPKDGHFVYQAGQVVAIMGANHARIDGRFIL